MGKGSSPPAAPNYTQIAKDQSGLDREAMTEQTFANRPNQNSPWGAMSWSPGTVKDPVTGKTMPQWTQNQTLPGELQGALDQQFGIAGGRSDIAAGMMGRAGESYTDPVDYSQFMDVTGVEGVKDLRQRAEDATYNRATSRLDPEFAIRDEQLEIALRNKGLRPGDQAYEAEMDRYGRAKTDAYQTAQDASVSSGRAEAGMLFGQQQSQQAQSSVIRQSQISEELQRRGVPLSEINDLLAGQGIQAPSAAAPGSFAQQGYRGGADLMGAARAGYGAQADQWNAQQAQQQGMMSGLGTIAGLGVSMFSDRRLKRDIKRIGSWRGYPVYTFQYIWGVRAVGVMSDEVNSDAVSVGPSGFDLVDYARVR